MILQGILQLLYELFSQSIRGNINIDDIVVHECLYMNTDLYIPMPDISGYTFIVIAPPPSFQPPKS